MARSVRWSEIATRDLEGIADHVAADSPTYAAQLIERILDLSWSLDELAGRGRVVPEFKDPDIREVFCGSYRLIYSTGPEVVHILGVIHGARLLKNQWDDDERRS